ncbi:MAG: thermonuclease family protein [Acidimicrobiales bacterium]
MAALLSAAGCDLTGGTESSAPPAGNQTATGSDPAEPGGGGSPVDTGVVERVVDGDTVILELAGESERVRLIGVDSPESVAENRPVQCYGPEASDALKALLPPGTTVSITRDVESRDRYDRLLLYLHRASDGLFVNEWLVAEGYAESHPYPPNVTLQAQLDDAEAAARAEQRGLWGSCDGPDQPLN